MRIGVDSGRVLTADIGTPRRMEHVLLGTAVEHAKLTEANGRNQRVNLSEVAYERVKDQLRFEDGKPFYKLVVDDLTDEQLGEYEIAPRRRQASNVLFERSVAGPLPAIDEPIKSIQPLARFIPSPAPTLPVEKAAERHTPPHFPEPTLTIANSTR